MGLRAIQPPLAYWKKLSQALQLVSRSEGSKPCAEVVAVAVADGETVEAGQRLAVVEAMKMEHALVAPYAGIVRGLEAALGDQVEMGATLMRIEKAGARRQGPAEGK